MKALELRQKLIWQAGRSEFGYDAAEEYEMDELGGMMMTPSAWKVEKAAEEKVMQQRIVTQFCGRKENGEPGLSDINSRQIPDN